MKSSFLRSWLEAALVRVARALGVGVAKPAPPDAAQLLGSHLSKLFSHLRVNCVLDVGANRGQYGLFLRRIGYEGWIISFEPAPADFERLDQCAAADPRWRAHRLALGEEEGEMAIHLVGADSLFNSFLAPSSYMEKWGMQTDARLAVPVRRLDAIFMDVTRDVAPARVFLKSDTQGYDLQVVKGARGVLPSVLALQVEVAFQPLYEGMTPATDVITTLTDEGFDVTGIFPISIDDELRLVEADCVMVSRAVAGPLGALHPPEWSPS